MDVGACPFVDNFDFKYKKTYHFTGILKKLAFVACPFVDNFEFKYKKSIPFELFSLLLEDPWILKYVLYYFLYLVISSLSEVILLKLQ